MNCTHFNDAVSFYFLTTADQPDFLIKIPQQLLGGLPGNLVQTYTSLNCNTVTSLSVPVAPAPTFSDYDPLN